MNKIVDIGDISNTDTILEIGPGTGNLTEKIIDSKPSKVYLIEKDNFLLDQLRNKFDYNIEFLKFESILYVSWLNYFF